MRSFNRFLFLGFCLSFFSNGALAITRTAYFSQTARNSSISGPMNSPLQSSSCTIILTNPSSQSQTVTGTLTMTGRTVVTAPSASNTTFTQTPVSLATSIAAGGTSAPFAISAPLFVSTNTGYQDVTCSGTITVSDSGANPGFLVATGVLMSFTESSNFLVSIASGFNSTNARQPVYIQVSVPINEGRPF